MHFTLLFGSYRHDRKGIRAALYVEAALKARGHETRLVDAGALELPIYDRMFKEYPAGTAPAPLPELAENHRKTDAFVIISGEYNYSVQPGLKNLLDVFLEEYFWRPSALVTYSASEIAGLRVAVHLNAVMAEMGMPTISSILSIGNIGQSLDENGNDPEGKLQKRADRFLNELEWYAEALKRQREEKGKPW